jgi:uncharacterized membrane protein
MSPALARVRNCVLWLLLAAAIHGLAVWALPRVVMRGAMSRLVPTNGPVVDERVRVFYPPLTTAAARQIVLPSPDLAYALCVYDLSKGPVDVDAALEWSGYWSVALYADNNDNYLVRNDRVASTRPVHWRLVLREDAGATAATALAAAAEGRELVFAPTARGLLLMRVLVADRHREAVAAAQAQRSLRCVAAL